MSKKIVSFSLCTCFFIQASVAQRIMHSVGATSTLLFGKIDNLESTFILSQDNITYFPRFNFIQNKNASLSIGFPVGAGIGITSTFDDQGLYFGYDLQAVLDYNTGFRSSAETDKKMGAYFGAGFGYSSVSISNSLYSDFKGISYGPLLRAGIRFGLPDWNKQGFTLGVYYKKGMENGKLNTIGFNVFYDL